MEYYFKDSHFVIEDYDKQSTFSSFLPAVAGRMGKPLWAYYVNRGQLISSFGVKDKNQSILEFSPAVTAYQLVQTQGFRTFLKVNGKFVEPFSVGLKAKRKMLINESSVGIIEENTDLGYKISVNYFGVPEESFPGLARTVKLENISGRVMNLELLDGLSMLIPNGLSNNMYKDMGNTMKSWMDVFNLEKSIPFFRLRASGEDTEEVSEIKEGDFYLGRIDNAVALPIVDKSLIFGYDESMVLPTNFMKKPLNDILKENNVTANKVPVCFIGTTKNVDVNSSLTINSMFGYTENIEEINKNINKFDQTYFENKEKEAYSVIRKITDDIETHTSNIIFDEYSRQSYLDNFIRGGYPAKLDDNKEGLVYYLYGRKHGDLERDYNWFNIEPEYYSQGNGAYRDSNQNRRNDVLFKNYVKDFSIKMFMDLVQIDGYNPLTVNGVSFTVEESKKEELIKKIIVGDSKDFKYVLNKFTPGIIVNFLAFSGVKTVYSPEDCLKYVLEVSDSDFEASFSEGYWSDHFTYNYDLIENYLAVYPDKLEELLFLNEDYKYFQSPISIVPRSEKYVLTKDNHVRQYGSINFSDKSKEKALGIKKDDTNWLKDVNKKVYKTNLFEKLFGLSLIKFSTLDQTGIGIEMEGGKPGWNDALNGIPALIGSGVSETIELLRIVNFLKETVSKYPTRKTLILTELIDFSKDIEINLNEMFNDTLNDYKYWDKVSTLREEFRAKTDLYVSGKKKSVELRDLNILISLMKTKLEASIEKALKLGNGILPSYIINEATKYEKILDKSGKPIISHYGLPNVKVTEWSARALPYFLEAPARGYKILPLDKVMEMHKKVKQTELYDIELKMYHTSVNLDTESFEIGRIRAFTKGWLERESNFLHMTYKYLIGLLKAGDYKDFYTEMENNLVAFMDPKVYGRSTLENSSFLATSGNPDTTTHGKGYVSRLTGANTEFLQIWQLMMFGKSVFKLKDSELMASFNPIIPAFLFDEKGEVTAKFMSTTFVTYKNPKKINTDLLKVSNIVLDGVTLNRCYLNKAEALNLRNGKYKQIVINLI